MTTPPKQIRAVYTDTTIRVYQAYSDAIADAALAAAVAVKSANMQDKVKVIGFDGMKEARDAVDSDPVMVGVIRQFPDQMGKQAVDTAVAVMKGEKVPAEQPIEPGGYTGKE